MSLPVSDLRAIRALQATRYRSTVAPSRRRWTVRWRRSRRPVPVGAARPCPTC